MDVWTKLIGNPSNSQMDTSVCTKVLDNIATCGLEMFDIWILSNRGDAV